MTDLFCLSLTHPARVLAFTQNNNNNNNSSVMLQEKLIHGWHGKSDLTIYLTWLWSRVESTEESLLTEFNVLSTSLSLLFNSYLFSSQIQRPHTWSRCMQATEFDTVTPYRRALTGWRVVPTAILPLQFEVILWMVELWLSDTWVLVIHSLNAVKILKVAENILILFLSWQ